MVKISELYITSIGNRISESDLKELKQPLTISNIRIVGKTRKGCLMEFEETTLLHKCNRIDIMYLAKKLKVNDTEDFKGEMITLVADKETGIIRIKQDIKK